MKSIGIITYHNYNNYGTMLQAFALQHAIANMGYEAEIIDFKQNNSLSRVEMIKLRLKRLPVYIKEREKYAALRSAESDFDARKKKFEAFYNRNLVISKNHYTSTQQLVDNPPEYDAYIVGSDQTWNPYVANAPEAFYLPFVEDDKQKGSYGPSLAVADLTEEQRALYKKRLKDFAFLSCREQAGADLLTQVIGRKVEQVLDPTLLLDASEWEGYSADFKVDDPYILEYFLGEKKYHRDYVEKLSKMTGFRVISLPVTYLEIVNKGIDKVWGGPAEFLSLIKNASVVCTDSFHGTMFSINFNTNFYAFCKTEDTESSSENSRLYSALEMFHLRDRLVKVGDQPETSTLEIDFSEANRLLTMERDKSMAYLRNMLGTMTK